MKNNQTRALSLILAGLLASSVITGCSNDNSMPNNESSSNGDSSNVESSISTPVVDDFYDDYTNETAEKAILNNDYISDNHDLVRTEESKIFIQDDTYYAHNLITIKGSDYDNTGDYFVASLKNNLDDKMVDSGIAIVADEYDAENAKNAVISVLSDYVPTDVTDIISKHLNSSEDGRFIEEVTTSDGAVEIEVKKEKSQVQRYVSKPEEILNAERDAYMAAVEANGGDLDAVNIDDYFTPSEEVTYDKVSYIVNVKFLDVYNSNRVDKYPIDSNVLAIVNNNPAYKISDNNLISDSAIEPFNTVMEFKESTIESISIIKGTDGQVKLKANYVNTFDDDSIVRTNLEANNNGYSITGTTKYYGSYDDVINKIVDICKNLIGINEEDIKAAISENLDEVDTSTLTTTNTNKATIKVGDVNIYLDIAQLEYFGYYGTFTISKF